MTGYTSPTIYLLEHGAADPAWNMAVDETLLRERDAGRLEGSWIRLYAWQPPAVSLGRLQSVAAELDGERLHREGVPVVRRATGGKAVYHAAELTYSVVGGCGVDGWGGSLHETYRAVTRLVAAGLEKLGISTTLAPGRPDPGTIRGGELRGACFAVAYGHELLHRGRKICGSAQRRLAGSFLQHGSVLLGPEHAELATWLRTDHDRRALRRLLRQDSIDVQTALGREVLYEEVQQAMTRGIEDCLPSVHRLRSLPEPLERAAAARLEHVRVSLEDPAACRDD